jgi:hypothetical protein
MIALYAVWYDFMRSHKTLRSSTSNESGIVDHLFSFEDLVGDRGRMGSEPEREIILKSLRAVALTLFGVGDFILQFFACFAAFADHGVGAIHVWRMVVLAPVSLVPFRIQAWLPDVPPEGAVNHGLYTLLSVLLVNTLIWTMLFDFCLKAVSKTWSRLVRR